MTPPIAPREHMIASSGSPAPSAARKANSYGRLAGTARFVSARRVRPVGPAGRPGLLCLPAGPASRLACWLPLPGAPAGCPGRRCRLGCPGWPPWPAPGPRLARFSLIDPEHLVRS